MITIETLYGECHEAHGLKIRNLVNNLFQKHPRITAIRVDLHYPPVIDNGDTITCFPNLSPGEISRFRNSLNAKINADQHRKNNKANAPTQRRFVLSGRKNIRSPLNVIITSAFFLTKTPITTWETMSALTP